MKIAYSLCAAWLLWQGAASAEELLKPMESHLTAGDYVDRVQDHLVIGDIPAAVAEAEEGAKAFPESSRILIAKIKALSAAGREKEMMQAWAALDALDTKAAHQRDLVEVICWGTIRPAALSTQPSTRFIALLSAGVTRDAYALPIMLSALQGSNTALRGMAVQWVPNYRDAPLYRELLRLLKEEEVWSIRLEVIRSLGRMQQPDGLEPLKALVADPSTTMEERRLAVAAIAAIMDEVDTETLKALVSSNRAGLRELACGLLVHHDRTEDLPLLVPLLGDTQSGLQIAALNAFGTFPDCWPADLGVEEKIALLAKSAHEGVAITAAWALAMYGNAEGFVLLEKWAKTPSLTDADILAAGALATLGPPGVASMKAVMKGSASPFVRANVAIGLIGQREELRLASRALREVLEGEAKIMFQGGKNPRFELLMPCDAPFRMYIPNYPEVVNQSARLELVNLLAVVGDPQALEMARAFLRQQAAGISAMAGELILSEGEEGMVALVRQLLDDPDKKIRLQAAILLGVWGRDATAIKTLEEMYPSSDRDTRLQILEVIGVIGDPTALPFLMECLNDPFRTLRVVAASSIIRILRA